MTDQDDDRAARGDTDGGVASTRLCVGCRRDEARDDVLRFAISPDAPYLSPDPMRRLGGRGVSVHATRACITAAVRKGGFAKALRKSVSLDASALCAAAANPLPQDSCVLRFDLLASPPRPPGVNQV